MRCLFNLIALLMGFKTLIGSLCTCAKMTAFSSRRGQCRTFPRKMPQGKVTLPHVGTVHFSAFVL